jgi:periplasmic protein TonB
MLSIKMFFANGLFLAGVEVSSTMLLAGTLGTVGLVLAGMAYMKGYFNHQSQALQNGKVTETEDSVLQRKYEEVSTRTYRPTFLWAGGAAALMLCFLVINWTRYTQEYFSAPSDLITPDETYSFEPPVTPPTPPPPPTELKLPPPPAMPTTFVSVTGEIDENPNPPDPNSTSTDPNATGTVTTHSTTCMTCPMPATPPIVQIELPKEKDIVDEILTMSEEMPLFPSCEEMQGYSKEKKACAEAAMLAFIYKNIRYPEMARTLGVSGTAVISFVVGKDGRLNDIKIIKKVGAGLEEEAKRVVELMAALPTPWIPGRQSGRPVKVKYNLPVKFKM